MPDDPLILLPLPEAEGGGWLAVAPDLWGCMGDGATPEEAIRDFKDAFRAWSEVPTERGDPLPQPGSFLEELLGTLSVDQAAGVRRRLWEIAPIGDAPVFRSAAAE